VNSPMIRRSGQRDDGVQRHLELLSDRLFQIIMPVGLTPPLDRSTDHRGAQDRHQFGRIVRCLEMAPASNGQRQVPLKHTLNGKLPTLKH